MTNRRSVRFFSTVVSTSMAEMPPVVATSCFMEFNVESVLLNVESLLTCLLCSFESWFDIDTLGEAENVVAAEREQNILSMLHQVSPPNHQHTVYL